KALTKWLIEYNQNRPHASLDYLTPLEYFESNLNVLPMCPAHTPSSFLPSFFGARFNFQQCKYTIGCTRCQIN
ncbi:integrase core domain-containing protein, partial [Patescibacteria group bacterium]|nr:integrase core domain-containing protein [Patescibacteria group bacterium]